jgi:thioredoxin-dependent peroxiredoxin
MKLVFSEKSDGQFSKDDYNSRRGSRNILMNMKAKNFKLRDEDGKYHSLADYQGKWLVLYFYPKDDTPGCTIEACEMRDKLRQLQQYGVEVVGISKDTVESHKKFKEKYHLNFHLLSDETKVTIVAYDAWEKRKFLGKEYEGTSRKTYLIDMTGEIRKIYNKVVPVGHAGMILGDIKKMSE